MKLRNYILLTLSICFINFGVVKAQSESDSISNTELTENRAATEDNEADVAYRNNNFTKSIQLYEAQIAQNKLINQESAQLYYNLGNAYFRNNQISKAIVNYERALLLDPSDSDIKHNLRFAKTRIEDKIDSADSFFANQWIRSVQNLYNANTWAAIAIVLFIVMVIAIGFYAISVQLTIRKVSFYTAITLLFLVVTANVFAFKQKNKITNRSTGIVMSASVSIYTSPDAHSKELFRLHEGAKVKIKREEGKWIEIVIANGSVGWLQKKSIEVI